MTINFINILIYINSIILNYPCIVTCYLKYAIGFINNKISLYLWNHWDMRLAKSLIFYTVFFRFIYQFYHHFPSPDLEVYIIFCCFKLFKQHWNFLILKLWFWFLRLANRSIRVSDLETDCSSCLRCVVFIDSISPWTLSTHLP